MKKYVLDALIILTFLLGEKTTFHKKVSSLLKKTSLGNAELYSSYLLPLEISNGLRYSLKNEKLAGEALEKSLNLPIELVNFSSVQYSKILQLSFRCKTSFYDSSYHFLAIIHKATFLTADKKYFQKAKQLGNIELLLS